MTKSYQIAEKLIIDIILNNKNIQNYNKHQKVSRVIISVVRIYNDFNISHLCRAESDY